jgi:hypothetical protein
MRSGQPRMRRCDTRWPCLTPPIMTMRNTRPIAIPNSRRQPTAALAWHLTLGLPLAALLLSFGSIVAAGTSLPTLAAPHDELPPPTVQQDDGQKPLADRLPGPPLPKVTNKAAEEIQAGNRPQPLALRDDIWLIETRTPSTIQPAPQVYRYERGGRCAASLSEFLAANEDGLPLCIWIHGYQVCPEFAERMGLAVYEQLRQLRPCGTHFRFLIWSWPSQKDGSYRVDAPRKARQSDVEGFKLAQVIQKLPPQVPVSLMGFSFGARAVGATLHFLGCGRIANMALPDCEPASRPVRAVLLAGALDHDAFSPKGLNNHAAQAVNRVCVLVNRRDPVLIAYRHLETFRGQLAMGHTGPVGVAEDQCPGQFSVRDVSATIGFSHNWTRYIYSPEIMQSIAPLVLYADWFKPVCQETSQPLAPAVVH